MLTNTIYKDSLQRALLAVAIVFSIAVIIAVSDPRPSGSSAMGTERSHASGRRYPPPVPPTPAPGVTTGTTTQQEPAVAIEAPPTALPEPTQNLLQIVANTAELAGLVPAVVPAGDCNTWVPVESADLPTTFSCAPGAVVATAAGRVLIASDSGGAPTQEPSPVAEPWSWTRGLSLGKFVVIDHGPTEKSSSTITVYSRLTEIDPALKRGVMVEGGQRVGSLGAEGTNAQSAVTFGWEMWVNDVLPGVGFPPVPPSADTALFEALEISAANVTMPVSGDCPFPAGDRLSLPNSARVYRSGVHQGIDFGCGATSISARAFTDGVVTMVVSDIVEPTVPNRNLLLNNAAQARDTPHWTLTHLYGNFVVVDHGEFENVGRVMTVYAHLANVDPGIVLGQPVTAGQVIGDVGDSGTSAAAALSGDPSAIHLHWEIQIDSHYLGEGLSAAATEQVYRSLLCRANDTISCT